MTNLRNLIISAIFLSSFLAHFSLDAKTIYLSGENHYTDGEDADFQKLIIKLAAERRLVYAMEGLEREALAEKEFSDQAKAAFGTKGTPFIFGVEDPVFVIFKETLTLGNHLRSLEMQQGTLDSNSANIVATKKNDILCPLVHRSNQNSLKEFWSDKQIQSNPIFIYLKKNKESLVKKHFAEQTRIFASQIRTWTNQDWIGFNRRVTEILAPHVSNIILVEKRQTLEFLLSCLDNWELGSDCDPGSSSLVFMNSLHLTLRNDFIVQNLEWISDRSANLIKPLVCILGEAHIVGVKAALEEKGYTVLDKAEFLDTLSKADL